MAENFSEFGIDIGLSASGFDSVLSKFKHLASEGEKIGKTTNEITEAMKRLKAAMEHSLNLDSVNKNRTLLTETDPDKRRTLTQQIANNAERLKTLQDAAAMAQEDFLNPKGNGEGLLSLLKKVGVAWGQVYVAMKPVRVMYRWVDGVAQLNMQLRMLHYSSGMAIASLKAYGNVASLYGGSANSVASYNERHQVQLARARRGLGLGHFQEAAWQFGFRFDANEDPNARFRRAIEHMRKLSPTDQLAFAKLEAPGREKELMAWAKRGVQSYDSFKAYMDSVANIKTVGGKKLFDVVSKESEELAESQKKLSAEFDAAKNEFAATFLPALTAIADAMTAAVRGFNSLDPMAKRIIFAGGALIAAFISAASAIAALKTIAGIAKGLKGLGALGEVAGGVAGGARGAGSAAGIAKGAGGALAAGIGGSAISAIGDAGIGYLLYVISDSILIPWFTAWKAVNMITSYSSQHKKEMVNYMKAGGIDEKEANFLLLGGLQKLQYRDQQFSDHKALYKKLEEIVAASQSGAAAQFERVTNNISGDVKNDNRTFTIERIEQNFVSSGDVRHDAEVAKAEMQKLDLYDSILNS